MFHFPVHLLLRFSAFCCSLFPLSYWPILSHFFTTFFNQHHCPEVGMWLAEMWVSIHVRLTNRTVPFGMQKKKNVRGAEQLVCYSEGQRSRGHCPLDLEQLLDFGVKVAVQHLMFRLSLVIGKPSTDLMCIENSLWQTLNLVWNKKKKKKRSVWASSGSASRFVLPCIQLKLTAPSLVYSFSQCANLLLLLLGQHQLTPDPPPHPPPPTSHRFPMALFLQPTLSSIATGKQSQGNPVSTSSRSTNVRSCPPTLLLPCLGFPQNQIANNYIFPPPAVATEPKAPL